MKNILVVGYSGLVGEKITQYLIDKSYRVYGANSRKTIRSNFNQGFFTHIELQDIKNYNFSSIIIAIQNPAFKEDLGAYVNLDLVYQSEELVKEYLFQNPKCSLILLSSVATYGNYQEIFNVDQLPRHPSNYGKYKVKQEEIFDLKSLTNQITILRLPAILVRNAVNHFPSRIISKLVEHKEILITNPEKLWNSCLLIDDLNYLVYLLIENKKHFSKFLVPHSLGSVKILDLVNYMKEMISSKSTIKIDYHSESSGVALINIDPEFNTCGTLESIALFVKMSI
jgi:nucleoside-diphosphate-sugar epimerase